MESLHFVPSKIAVHYIGSKKKQEKKNLKIWPEIYIYNSVFV